LRPILGDFAEPRMVGSCEGGVSAGAAISPTTAADRCPSPGSSAPRTEATSTEMTIGA
jgi:hypothetical protein